MGVLGSEVTRSKATNTVARVGGGAATTCSYVSRYIRCTRYVHTCSYAGCELVALERCRYIRYIRYARACSYAGCELVALERCRLYVPTVTGGV